MRGLREHVKRLHSTDVVPGRTKPVEVTSQGGSVTRKIKHVGRPDTLQGFDATPAQSRSRRIHHDHVVFVVGHRLQKVLDLCRAYTITPDMVLRGRLFGISHGIGILLDFRDQCSVFCQTQSHASDPGI